MARELFTSAQVENDRAALRKLSSLPTIIFMKQVHGAQVLLVGSKSEQDQVCDGLVTTEKNLGLAVASADCLPILLHSDGVVGAAHAGRRGVVNGVISKTVEKMRAAGAGEIVASIGPAICGNCYEVSPDMYEELRNSRVGLDGGTNHLDIAKSAKAELLDLKVEVFHYEICTKENANYYSFRRDGTSLRQFGVISL